NRAPPRRSWRRPPGSPPAGGRTGCPARRRTRPRRSGSWHSWRGRLYTGSPPIGPALVAVSALRDKVCARFGRPDRTVGESRPLHVDLFLVRMTEELTVDVPLIPTGTSSAVENLNGTLMHQLDSVRIKALPDHLPQSIEYSIESLVDFDTVVKVSDLTIPGDVTLLTDADEVVAKVLASRLQAEAAELAAETAAEAAEAAEGVEPTEPAEGAEGEGPAATGADEGCSER